MLEKNTVVSVIMNCHNGEEFLKESVHSIINQTFTDWELIFYDNDSSDRSLEIIKSFNDQRIKIFRSQNFLNLYHARNKALKKINGKYICFLDTDDLWENNKLEQQVEFLEKNKNFIMVYSNFYTLKNGKKFIQYENKLPEGNITKYLLKKYTIGILTTCLKKEAFEDSEFDKNTNIIGDFDFFINLSNKFKIGCIQKPLAYYRDHDKNLSKKKLEIYILELSKWIKEHNKKFQEYKTSLVHLKYFLLKLKIKNFLKKLGV